MPWPESKWMFSWYCPMGASAGAEMATSVDWGPLGTALALQASLLCGWLRLTRKMALSGPGPGEGGEEGTRGVLSCLHQHSREGRGRDPSWAGLTQCLDSSFSLLVWAKLVISFEGSLCVSGSGRGAGGEPRNS